MIYYLKHSSDIVQNFYFIIERRDNKSEWNWYEENIVKYFENQLRLKNTFTSKQIHRAIGLINVNAVALQMPKLTHAKKGKDVVFYYTTVLLHTVFIHNSNYTINSSHLFYLYRLRHLFSVSS